MKNRKTENTQTDGKKYFYILKNNKMHTDRRLQENVIVTYLNKSTKITTK